MADRKRRGGHPPKEHQFKKGQSGNPGGRPKGRRSPRDVAWDLLDRIIAAQVNGERVRVSTLEALMQAHLAELTRKPKGLIEFLDWLEKRSPTANDDAVEEPLSEDDEALLEDLIRRAAGHGRRRDV